MGVYKDDKTNTWRVIYRYTDWTGEQKQSSRRGFASKHEAQAWEREQMNKVTADLDMTFASFVEHYTEDLKTRLKENTWSTKDHIIRTKLIREQLMRKFGTAIDDDVIDDVLRYGTADIGEKYLTVIQEVARQYVAGIMRRLR